MKFAKVIEATGLEPNVFPEVSKIDIEVFDWNNREIEEEDFVFTQSIFVNEPTSLNKFSDFLKGFNPETDKIFHVILHEKSLIITTSDHPLILPR